MYRYWLAALVTAISLGLGGCGAPPAAAPAGGAAPKPTGGGPPAAAPASAPAAASAAEPAGAGQPAAAPAARQPLSPRVTVRYGELGQASDAGFYLALDRGYFAEEGLDVEAVQIGSGGRMVPGLGAGQIEVGGGGLSTALINAVVRDVPLRLVADKGSLRPGFGYAALLVRKELVDSGAVRTAADLVGRKVALNTTTSMDIYSLNGALEKAGARVDDVTLEEIAYPDMIAALANGSVDAATPLEPIATAIVRQGIGVRLLGFDETTPNSQLGAIMYAPHFMRDQPEAARRFVLAYLRGIRDYNRAFTTGERRDEAIQTLTRHTTIKDPAVFEQMTLPGLNPNGYLNLESIMATQEFWRRLGLMPATVPAEQFVDHSYVDWALGILGRQ